MAAADDPDLPQIATQVIDAGIAPDVLDALPQIAGLLDSQAMQNAVPTVTAGFTPTPYAPRDPSAAASCSEGTATQTV
jgi:hypothetical protein